MKFLISLLFLLASFNFSVYAQHATAYKPGEELKFKVKYGWFKTSEASLSVESSNLDGVPVHHVIGFGRTTGMLDLFFKVRDSFESYIGVEDGLPRKFVRQTNEGGHRKDKMIEFKHAIDSAVVHDFKHDTVSTHHIKNETQDLMSALYALRNLVDEENLKKGQEFNLTLFFDEENFGFKAKFLGEEVLDTKFGKVKALKFRPYVQAERVFKEEESVTIWVSKDKNKIPLRVEADLAVGSLTATLQEFRGLSNSFSSFIFD